MPQPYKSLVLCFDGTWNTLKSHTNVSRLYSEISDVSTGCLTQRKFYDEGVGTHWYDPFGGGAFGIGLDRNIRLGYAWLASVFESGRNPAPQGANVDYHIHIGFDPAAAKRLRERWVPNKDEKHGLQAESVIVEMTPHYRLWHQPDWSNELLAKVIGRQVKVVGQLLADNEHDRANDSCAHPNANKQKCWHASIWELHPVTEFYVCGPNADSTCTEASPNWVKLKDVAP